MRTHTHDERPAISFYRCFAVRILYLRQFLFFFFLVGSRTRCFKINTFSVRDDDVRIRRVTRSRTRIASYANGFLAFLVVYRGNKYAWEYLLCTALWKWHLWLIKRRALDGKNVLTSTLGRCVIFKLFLLYYIFT